MLHYHGHRLTPCWWVTFAKLTLIDYAQSLGRMRAVEKIKGYAVYVQMISSHLNDYFSAYEGDIAASRSEGDGRKRLRILNTMQRRVFMDTGEQC